MWGDSALATPQLLDDGRCQYLMYEALAEITMAILTKAHAKDPTQGYARDIIKIIIDALPRLNGVKVITNAGGVNPIAAANVIREAAAGAKLNIRVAAVTGDDLMSKCSEIGVTAAPVSFNAYLGARPIAAALDAGADIVITGRCADSALALGPLIHEFGWKIDDYDKLSAGSLAGHLLECGPQSTGGLLTDWKDTKSWAISGFPIAEVTEDGVVTIRIASGTDGLVDRRTVTEQMLYEIGDPTAYLLPDVACDWTQVKVRDIGPNRVSVMGAKGTAPPSTLKACAQIADGYAGQITFFVGGRDAVAKARRLGQNVLSRMSKLLPQHGFADFRKTHVDVVGSEDGYGEHARAAATREVVLRVGVHHEDRKAVTFFIREFPSIALAGPPGVGTFIRGLPQPSPLLRLETHFVPRNMLSAEVTIGDRSFVVDDVPLSHCLADRRGGPDAAVPPIVKEPTVSVPLMTIAHGRSGDKGDSANIAIIARSPDFEPIVHAQVTKEQVGAHLRHLQASSVKRFVLPGVHAVNFLLMDALGGGGTSSLRLDTQGKAFAQQLLDMPIQIPERLLAHKDFKGEYR